MKRELKKRLTAFINPDLVKRAKVRGALEGLTISDIVEKALDAYAPKIEKGDHNTLMLIPKHSKSLTVPR